MANLSIRDEIRVGDSLVKLINEESISVCSKYTKQQIRTWLENNYPNIWDKVKTYTTELEILQCPHDATKNHYTLMLDR